MIQKMFDQMLVKVLFSTVAYTQEINVDLSDNGRPDSFAQ